MEEQVCVTDTIVAGSMEAAFASKLLDLRNGEALVRE